MASSDFLRSNINQHSIKNSDSKNMDKEINIATKHVIKKLSEKYNNVRFEWIKKMNLNIIVNELKKQFPEYSQYFTNEQDSSFISPDWWFLFAINKNWEKRLILVSEVKRQGTNDARFEEGKPKQALWNAIERLWKNLIGIRAIFKSSWILPFVCFWYGYDFQEWSSIRDRVITMNEFFPLNTVFCQKDFLPFEPVSMFFRQEQRSIEEMQNILFEIAENALLYKFI